MNLKNKIKMKLTLSIDCNILGNLIFKVLSLQSRANDQGF